MMNSDSNREHQLLRSIRCLTWFFILSLVISGATAIPLEWELDVAANLLGVAGTSPDQATSGLTKWILKVRDGLHETNAHYPFLAYGTDWLAFGHFVIAICFLGALRDPVRNIWLFNFGLIACVLVVPWALVFGALRGIPFEWRLIDCCFGVIGFIPLWLCRRYAMELSGMGQPEEKTKQRRGESGKTWCGN